MHKNNKSTTDHNNKTVSTIEIQTQIAGSTRKTSIGSNTAKYFGVVISNMPYGINEESIRKYFAKSGEIKHTCFFYLPKIIMKNPGLGGFEMNYCLIEYTTAEAANHAVKQEFSLMNKRMLINKISQEDY